MVIVLEKQPAKYLASVDEPTREKLWKALDGLKEWRGDIVRLAGTNNLFRLKIEHYRAIFSYDGGKIIVVEALNTRTNIKYRRFRR